MKKNINRIKVVLVDKGKTSAQEKSRFPRKLRHPYLLLIA